jgi:hypothetical protein
MVTERAEHGPIQIVGMSGRFRIQPDALRGAAVLYLILSSGWGSFAALCVSSGCRTRQNSRAHGAPKRRRPFSFGCAMLPVYSHGRTSSSGRAGFFRASFREDVGGHLHHALQRCSGLIFPTPVRVPKKSGCPMARRRSEEYSLRWSKVLAPYSRMRSLVRLHRRAPDLINTTEVFI